MVAHVDNLAAKKESLYYRGRECVCNKSRHHHNPKMFHLKELLSIDKKPFLFGLLTVATLVTLSTLLYYNTANFFAGENDGKRDRWRNEEGDWDPDFGQEEKESLKIVLCNLILIVGCISMIIPAIFVWHPTRGSISKVSVGFLAAVTFMFGQMAFVSCWYFSDFARQDEENRYLKEDNGNNHQHNHNQNQVQNYYYSQQEMSEDQLLTYHQNLTRGFLIAIALLYCILAVYLYDWARKLPSSCTNLIQEQTGQTVTSYKYVWKFYSFLSILIMFFQTLRAITGFFGERGQRMREEGLIYNAFIVVFWTLLLTSLTFFSSYKAIVKKEWTDAAGVGALGGCYIGLGMIFFMLFLLYCFVSLEDGMEQEMPFSLAVSACAFNLSMQSFFLGWLTLHFSESIIADIGDKNVEVSSEYHNMDKRSCNGKSDRRYTQPAVYSHPAVPVRQDITPVVPVSQFSDSEYVKDFDDEELPTVKDC